MNYIESALERNQTDVNGVLKAAAEKSAEDTQKEIDRLNELIDKSNEKIKRWQNAKLTADKYQKKALNSLIQGEKEVLITNNILLDNEKEKQKEYLATAKAYVEASEIIKESYKDLSSISKDELSIAQTSYKIWLQNNEDTATKSQLLAKELEVLNEKLLIQSNSVENVKIAYDKMVESYGITYSESKNMYDALLNEVYAYNQIAEAIENVYASQKNNNTESIFAMNDYLKKYKSSLLENGFTEEEVYEVARKVSGYEQSSLMENVTLPVKLSVDADAITEAIDEISVSVTTDPQTLSSYKDTGISFASALGEGFMEKFKEVSGNIMSFAQSTAKGALITMQNSVNNSTTNYNFTTAPQTIHQQIADAKRTEEMNKARGIK